ncbi:MAG: prepilin-type N-terminal cleavage/methylation domain-containing protein [Candidatus Aminicenantales bacterium]
MVEKSQDDGFSLIEILVAIVILATVLMTLVTVFVYGFNVISRTRQVALATQIAQEEVEIIRNMPFDDILNLGTTFTNDKISRLHNGQGALALENSEGNDIKKLTVSITWAYRGQTQRKDVVTLITREGINKK